MKNSSIQDGSRREWGRGEFWAVANGQGMIIEGLEKWKTCCGDWIR